MNFYENPRRAGRGVLQAKTSRLERDSAMNKYSTNKSNSQKRRVDGIWKRQDHVIFKTGVASNHMICSPIAWAIDKSFLSNAINSGLKCSVIYEKVVGLFYQSFLKDSFAHGIEIDRKAFGNQIVLPIKYRQITTPGQVIPNQMFLPY